MKKEYEELYKVSKTEEEALVRLVEIVKILRVECPWDKVQTHESLTTCMVEEAYEVVDAIKNNDVENLREELGDVLLQVVFHGILSEEEKQFDLAEVINEECEKMIRRHPHIFLEDEAKTIDKVLEKWENVKSKEHSEEKFVERLERVPKVLPSLMRGYKVQKKASQIGFDWDSPEDVFPKVLEEFEEVKDAYDRCDSDSMKEELGDLLFSVVNLARHLEINPEEAMNDSTDKFIRRFGTMEKSSLELGNNLETMTLNEMDELWNEAKKLSK